MGRDQTHKVIWNFCFIICLLVFGGWFLSASSGYLEMSASSSVSMKFGDEGDKFVRFPTLTFCKVSLVHDLWRNKLPCKRFSNLNSCLLQNQPMKKFWGAYILINSGRTV